jgi:hypothetical protein
MRAEHEGTEFPLLCRGNSLTASAIRMMPCREDSLTAGNSVLAECWKLPGPSVGINYALGLLIASGTSEFLSFVLESIVRGGRAPRKKHWLAAVPTERLIVHAKASRLPQLVPHKPCPPARFEKHANQTMEMCRQEDRSRDGTGKTLGKRRKTTGCRKVGNRALMMLRPLRTRGERDCWTFPNGRSSETMLAARNVGADCRLDCPGRISIQVSRAILCRPSDRRSL